MISQKLKKWLKKPIFNLISKIYGEEMFTKVKYINTNTTYINGIYANWRKIISDEKISLYDLRLGREEVGQIVKRRICDNISKHLYENNYFKLTEVFDPKTRITHFRTEIYVANPVK